MDIEYLLK